MANPIIISEQLEDTGIFGEIATREAEGCNRFELVNVKVERSGETVPPSPITVTVSAVVISTREEPTRT